MRKVTIVTDGKDDVLDGILCPMIHGKVRARGEITVNCRTNCAWFRIGTELESHSSGQGSHYQQYAYCGDKLIGEVEK